MSDRSSRHLEQVNLTSRTAIALEIAAVGLIAWKYRTNLLRQHDEPNESERLPTPLSQDVDDGFVYVVTDGSDVEVGMKSDDEGFIAISGRNSDEGIEIDEDNIPNNNEALEALLQRIKKVRRSWAHRKKV